MSCIFESEINCLIHWVYSIGLPSPIAHGASPNGLYRTCGWEKMDEFGHSNFCPYMWIQYRIARTWSCSTSPLVWWHVVLLPFAWLSFTQGLHLTQLNGLRRGVEGSSSRTCGENSADPEPEKRASSLFRPFEPISSFLVQFLEFQFLF